MKTQNNNFKNWFFNFLFILYGAFVISVGILQFSTLFILYHYDCNFSSVLATIVITLAFFATYSSSPFIYAWFDNKIKFS